MQQCLRSMSASKGRIRNNWKLSLNQVRIGVFFSFLVLGLLYYLLTSGSKNAADDQYMNAVLPNHNQWKLASDDLSAHVKNGDKKDKDLIVYFVDESLPVYSLDVLINNVKLFSSTVNCLSSSNSFYLFNVIGGSDNPLYQYLPKSLPNVAVVDWSRGSFFDVHYKTIKSLDSATLSKFSTVFFVNQFARGPLIRRDNNEWKNDIKRILGANGVGVVTSSISCEEKLHIDSSFFALSSKAVASLRSFGQTQSSLQKLKTIQQLANNYHYALKFSEYSVMEESIRMMEIAFSDLVTELGFKIHSMLDATSNTKCTAKSSAISKLGIDCGRRITSAKTNAFTSWGGLEMNSITGVCKEAEEVFLKQFTALNKMDASLGLIVPETVVGGALYHMYQEYLAEEHPVGLASPEAVSVSTAGDQGSKVCFLARTGSMHDTTILSRNSTSILYGIPELVKSLRGQTNPNWLLFAFPTDPTPFHPRLLRILSSYNDPRLIAFPVPSKYLPKFTKEDAGYTATDYVLKEMMLSRPECRWISVTNGDNVYGSNIVEQVLNQPDSNGAAAAAAASGAVGMKKPVSMLLAPIDSRNFAEQEYMYRREKIVYYRLDLTKNKHLPKFSFFQKPNEHHLRCIGVMANIQLRTHAYAVQPRPLLAKVDLASIFLLRESLQKEHIYFGNFTYGDGNDCPGCQDGYLAQYLVRNRNWSYRRLPIDGLKSIIYHGPSPTLCIASGNVWFDHPHVNKVSCMTPEAVNRLYEKDEGKGDKAKYDWKYFMKSKVCLRLSSYSFPFKHS